MGEKGSLNESITKLLVEQPLASPRSVKDDDSVVEVLILAVMKLHAVADLVSSRVQSQLP